MAEEKAAKVKSNGGSSSGLPGMPPSQDSLQTFVFFLPEVFSLRHSVSFLSDTLNASASTQGGELEASGRMQV